MSDILGELARVREAFDKPTLRLLERKWAPFVLAVFKSSFSGRQGVQADRLHLQVDAYLEELRSVGESAPEAAGRALCLKWMKDQWLYRSTDDSGEEQYSLTSHALEAMHLIEGLTRDRALISESRLTTILQTVRHWAMEANPVREDRIRRLDTQIAALTAERDRLAGGGEVFAATEDQMFDGYFNLVDLISQLPSDFKRVEEAVATMHRTIISDFREEDRPIGEVLDDYLTKSDRLMSATAEGRAFEGAVALLRDEAHLHELKQDLNAILEHPFSVALTPPERKEFRGTVTVIRRGIDDVLTQRTRLTTTLREHIVNHDVVKERELQQLLREIGKELATWMRSARPRAVVPVGLTPPTLDVTHLRERFYDPSSESPPPPLDDVSDEAPPPPSLEELRRQGGPLLAQMRAAVIDALSGGEATTVGAVFNNLNADLRRPVEIFGLVQMLTDLGVLDRDQGVEEFQTIRPDGTRRAFDVLRITLTQQDVVALAAMDPGAEP